MFERVKKSSFSGRGGGFSPSGEELDVPDPRQALDALSRADREEEEKKRKVRAERALQRVFTACGC